MKETVVLRRNDWWFWFLGLGVVVGWFGSAWLGGRGDSPGRFDTSDGGAGRSVVFRDGTTVYEVTTFGGPSPADGASDFLIVHAESGSFEVRLPVGQAGSVVQIRARDQGERHP